MHPLTYTMDTLPERVARTLLLAVGLLSLMTLWDTTPAGGAALVPLLHQQFLSALIAAALVSAVFARAIRLPVLAAALLSKLGFVAISLLAPGFAATPLLVLDLIGIAALLSAGVLLLRAERQQARWDGPMRTRLEA
ncbi:hypothetical protein [Polaromonas sp.]|uniref:hypothetical protein n=1 Tax=Polaromonas sp. TaxID=1869339 RepID=UPI00272FA024|nr:hypothetical protein [Polaromonas sp.]MDP1741343.1 hypothetical protein [Polaromonas sp.]